MSFARTTPHQRPFLPARLLAYRELAPLLARIRPDGMVGPDFFRAYFRSKVSYGKRTLVLRLVLEDLRAWRKNGELPRLTPKLLRKIVMYLEMHPRAPLRPFEGCCGGHDLPSHLGRLFGRWPMWGNEMARRAVVQPYFRDLRNEQPYPDVVSDVTAREARTSLARAARRAILTRKDADRFLTARFTTHVGDFFFDTGVPALDACNVLLFAAELFGRPGQSRALKPKIPLTLSKRLGIRRVCLPDLMFAVDILALALLGLMHPPDCRTPTRLQALVEAQAVESEVVRAALPELRELAWHHFRRLLLDASACSTLRAALATRTRWHNLYHTGLVFNLERLVYGGRTKSRFSQFGPFYARVDSTRMGERILRHYRRVDPEFAQSLRRSMQHAPEEFSGIGCRSLANALFHARWLAAAGEQPRVILPTVAQYRFGRPEPTSVKTRRRKGGSYVKRTPDARPIRHLPLLDELAARVPSLEV